MRSLEAKMSRDDGGPAFPQPAMPDETYYTGMSLRDWFAGQFAASLSHHAFTFMKENPDAKGPISEAAKQVIREIGVVAYTQADAMLKARESGDERP